MKIDSSTINMGSNRVYKSNTEATQTTTMTQPGTGVTATTVSQFRMSYAEASGYTYNFYNQGGSEKNPLVSDLYTNLAGSNAPIDQIRTSLSELHDKLLKEIEAFMERIRNQLLGMGAMDTQDTAILDLTTSSNQPGALWKKQVHSVTSYQETETTTFAGNGTVKTADGRSIDFNISMEMSRSFMESAETLNESTEYILTDPLVIQLSDAPDTISDQTFLFDLDGDGVKEEMSQLAQGNGFLALDANGNGVIDDGSELFGTKSGDGFKDLAAYDEDGNGWIDENDSVYSKLKIWTKDEHGNNKLMDLYQGDIGAIYLGSATTTYHHNDLETNDTKAVVRQTGVFLHESTGMAGTIQQIDFATKKVGDVA